MDRKTALNTIRAEYAKHGESTMASMRAYAETRISFDAYNKAMRAGIKMYIDGGVND